MKLSKISSYRAEIYGCAILWIMLFHGKLSGVYYFEEIPVLHYLGRFIRYGNMGVEIFLFLSGVSLYFSFQRNQDLNKYLKKRLLRIYPSMIMIQGAYWIFLYVMKRFTLSETLLSLSGIRFWFDGNPEVWYASLILILYLLYPYIYNLLYQNDSDSSVAVRTAILTIVIMMFTMVLSLTDSTASVYSNIEIGLTRFPVFILGCGFGKCVYEKRTLSKWWYILCAVAFFACFYCMETFPILDIYKRWFYMTGGIPAVFLLAGIMDKIPGICRNILAKIGGISLELYFAHLALRKLYAHNWFFYPSEEGNTLKYLIILLCSFPVAWLASTIPAGVLKRKQFKAKQKS